MNANSKADEGAGSEREPESQIISKVGGVVPPARRSAIYTLNAREGLDAAELVNAAFGHRTIGKAVPRKLEVVAPDGPSTAGGKHARQTIRLVPASGDAATVMCGFIEVAQKVVELRSYTTFAQQFEARFGQPCDITREEYTALCRDLQMTLTPFRYSFTYEPEAHGVPAPRVGERDKPALLKPVLLGVMVVVAAGVALTFLR